MKKQHGYKIKCLCSNQCGEYLSNKFSNYLTTHRIKHWLTVHDMPEQNGITERINCTLLERVCTMLHGTQLPKNLWGEALAHTVWLKNCTSTKALEQTTPLQALTGTKLDLSELHKWG